ncbi:hypothetical protein ACQ86N_28285 [Puia sp. P3]|uniref:hypothetical protein n=1 Tax=Puia sp. P3 TaxID=3423952 RepID=UPI003D664A18
MWGWGSVTSGYSVKKDRLEIRLDQGLLDIQPLTAKAIRVTWMKGCPAARFRPDLYSSSGGAGFWF